MEREGDEVNKNINEGNARNVGSKINKRKVNRRK